MLPCPLGQSFKGTSADDRTTCVEAVPGTFSIRSDTPPRQCDPNAMCPGKATILPNPRFWHAHWSTNQMQRCPNSNACRSYYRSTSEYPVDTLRAASEQL